MPSGIYIRTLEHNQKVSKGLFRAYRLGHRSSTLTRELSSQGGKAALKKLGYGFYLNLGVKARKARMLDSTKRKLEAWGLPYKGTIKIRKPAKKRHTKSYSASWAYKERGIFHYKHLGICTTRGFPSN